MVSIDLAEGLTAWDWVCLALDASLRPFQLEVDFMQIFKLLLGEVEINSDIGVLVAELKGMRLHTR